MPKLDVDDVNALAAAGKRDPRLDPGAAVSGARWNARSAPRTQTLAAGRGPAKLSFAVRSSATAEDLPDASFAGQQETFLNVQGLDNLLGAIKHVFASLYNDRAISYRVHQGFAHADVALSAGVQRMVRSDLGASGVMFTLDTESGFDQVVFITSAYGLGETVVQGQVNPDEFYVYKRGARRPASPAILRRSLGSKALQHGVHATAARPGSRCRRCEVPEAERRRFSITDAEVEELARYALIIEKHYGRPMDIEWGKDGIDGKLYILQARPGNGQGERESRHAAALPPEEALATCWRPGARSASASARGTVRLVKNAAEMDRVQPGDVLVTDMTDPDWEPVMKTRRGDRHQPRRAHLPRRDHRARAGHSGGGRLRRRDPAC